MGNNLKNELTLINDVMIKPANISSLECISTHTSLIKLNFMSCLYKKAFITGSYALLYWNYTINVFKSFLGIIRIDGHTMI